MDKSREIELLNIEISKCTACPLHACRKKAVPGDGSIDNRIMFIGEAPGADEDEQGRPFVGKAGQLLSKIIKSAGFNREEIFITNTVKCRPPDNRLPEDKEIKTCFSLYLESQIAIINPKIIVTVGSVATKAILSDAIGKEGITKLRGQIFEWRGIKVMPIFHPSYLLRNPSTEEGKPKWQTWKDILAVKKEYNELS